MLRTIAATAAATLALGGLAGCRTNVGTAATVGGLRITESGVNDFLTPTGADPSAVAAAKAQGQQPASPRSQVLQVLIQQRLFERTLAANGGVPAAGPLAASHDKAAQVLLQTSVAGSALDRSLASGLQRSGIRSSFGKTYLRTIELEYTLIVRKRLTRLPELVALIDKVHAPVKVSRRYGSWDAKTLAVDTSRGVPGFVTLQPTAGAGGAATSAAP
jgi:hypothetical protein